MAYNGKELALKAVILAAGRGQRVGSLGQNTPKSLLSFRPGQSILGYTLLSMGKAEIIERAVIVTGHLHTAVTRTIEDLSPNVDFEIQEIVNREYAIKSVLYSVEAGLRVVGDGDVLLMNGDTIFAVPVFHDIKRALLAAGIPRER